MRKLLRSERGASIVEFALLAPVMVLLLVGVIDVGRYTYYGILAANAARAGADYGAQNLTTAQDTTGMQSAATQDANGLANWGTVTVNATPLCSVSGGTPTTCSGAGASGPPTNTIYYVQVQVSGFFPLLFKYPGLPNNVPISGNSIMRVVSQ